MCSISDRSKLSLIASLNWLLLAYGYLRIFHRHQVLTALVISSAFKYGEDIFQYLAHSNNGAIKPPAHN